MKLPLDVGASLEKVGIGEPDLFPPLLVQGSSDQWKVPGDCGCPARTIARFYYLLKTPPKKTKKKILLYKSNIGMIILVLGGS